MRVSEGVKVKWGEEKKAEKCFGCREGQVRKYMTPIIGSKTEDFNMSSRYTIRTHNLATVFNISKILRKKNLR